MELTELRTALQIGYDVAAFEATVIPEVLRWPLTESAAGDPCRSLTPIWCWNAGCSAASVAVYVALHLRRCVSNLRKAAWRALLKRSGGRCRDTTPMGRRRGGRVTFQWCAVDFVSGRHVTMLLTADRHARVRHLF